MTGEGGTSGGMSAQPNNPQPPPGEELITLEEAGRRLGIRPRTVQDWIASGKLPVYEISPIAGT